MNLGSSPASGSCAPTSIRRRPIVTAHQFDKGGDNVNAYPWTCHRQTAAGDWRRVHLLAHGATAAVSPGYRNLAGKLQCGQRASAPRHACRQRSPLLSSMVNRQQAPADLATRRMSFSASSLRQVLWLDHAAGRRRIHLKVRTTVVAPIMTTVRFSTAWSRASC